jgi:Predicted phosphohydrolases
MYLVFFVIPVIVMIPIVIYLYIWFNRFLTLFPVIVDKLRHGLAAGAALVAAYFCWPIYRTGGMMIGHFLVISLLAEVVNVIIKKKKKGEIPKVWSFLYRSGIFSLVIVAVMFTYGYVNMQIVYEKDYTVSSEKVNRDLRFAVISDLHLGTNMDTEKLSGYLNEISAKKVDALFLVGDIFDENTVKEEMMKAAELFAQVKSAYGTYYVMGNHDPNHYRTDKKYTEDELRQALIKAGIHVLEDGVVKLDGINVIGRRDASSASRRETKELTEQVDQSVFTVLLDHQPLGLQANADAGIDLQISGHTHAGQIWPTGKLMELLGASEMNYGYKKIDHMNMIVTSGIGGWGYSIRTGGHCEYVIIEVTGTGK